MKKSSKIDMGIDFTTKIVYFLAYFSSLLSTPITNEKYCTALGETGMQSIQYGKRLRTNDHTNANSVLLFQF